MVGKPEVCYFGGVASRCGVLDVISVLSVCLQSGDGSHFLAALLPFLQASRNTSSTDTPATRFDTDLDLNDCRWCALSGQLMMCTDCFGLHSLQTRKGAMRVAA